MEGSARPLGFCQPICAPAESLSSGARSATSSPDMHACMYPRSDRQVAVQQANCRPDFDGIPAYEPKSSTAKRIAYPAAWLYKALPISLFGIFQK